MVETNIVFFELTGRLDAAAFVERLLERGVRMGAMGPRTVRAVTHLDVSTAQIERMLVRLVHRAHGIIHERR